MKGIRLVTAILGALLVLGSGIALGAQDSAEDPSPSDDAALRAAPQDEPGVELASKRTATSQTFRLPDGALETRIFESPINYRDDEGAWKPIGEGLEELGGGGFSNGPNRFDVRLPDRLGDEPVRLSVDGDWVSAELLGPETEPAQLVGDTASYASADGSATFELNGLANGLKEDIEIADASAPSSFNFELSVSEGLTPELSDDGSIRLQDGDDDVIFGLPAPVVSDSSSMLPTPDPVGYKLDPLGERSWRLTVAVDRDWLEKPERSWPATIDPTLTVASPSLDCTIGGTAGANGWGLCGSAGQKELYARYKHNLTTDEWSRTLLKFNLSPLSWGGLAEGPATYISSAVLSVNSPVAAINTTGVEARRITKAWASTANWRYATGGLAGTLWSTEGGDYNSEGTQILTKDRGSQAGWWNFDLTGAFQVKRPADGFILKLLDEKGGCCSERSAIFDSSAVADSQLRPKLTVIYYPPAPSSSKVVSPSEGTVSANRLKLKSRWTEPGVTGISFQYKTGSSGFQPIPAKLIHNAQGEEVAWPVAVSGYESEPLYFDAGHATGELTEKGGDVAIRALFEGPNGVAGYSEAAKAKIDPDKGGTRDATAQVGPGSLDLLTGSFTVARTDVSIPGITAGLEFARTHSSRTPGVAVDTSVLGRGWKPTVPVEAAGGAEWRSVREVFASAQEKEEGIGDYTLLTDLEGYEYAFEKAGGTYVSPPEASGYVLAHTAGSATFTLSDPDGNVTTFESSSGGAEYLPVSVSLAGGSTNSARMVYEIVGANRRLNKVIAPSAGINCTESPTTTLGCRSLVFTYQSASTWGAPLIYGSRLSKIRYYGPSGAQTMSSWEVAKYEYDSAGRLIAEWDPRISPALKETYSYIGSGESTPQGGQIKTITPPGEEPWTLEYSPLTGEAPNAGRLKSVKRASLLASPTVAQTTIAYQVPVSGSGAPYDMSGKAVAAWGQQDIPTDATAIFPPDQVPASPPTSYARASIYYMDAEGQHVNLATPSGAGTLAPSITTTEADEHGNVVRELSAQNRLRALAKGAESVTRSKELETRREFSTDGTELQQEWGPMHQVRLESGSTFQAQLHTTIQYNNGWPGTGVNPHLPTRVTTGAKIPNQGIDADQRVTETKYNWTLRKPTETIVDSGGLNLVTRMAYDSTTGLPTERSLPAKPEGGDARTTKFRYYGLSEQCPLTSTGYFGLPCEIAPAAQPGTVGQPELIVRKIASYSPMAQPTEVIESPGGKETATRKTITTYDAVGRQTLRKIEGGGTGIPPTQTIYSTTTGRPTETLFKCESSCEGFDSQALVTAYDKLGRPTEYLDADGNLSTVGYDLLGRPLTTNDGKGTQTSTYDPTSGLLVKLEDSAAGTFTAAYDADGSITEQGLPNGLLAQTTYDEVGAATNRSYTKVTNCSVNCTWLDFDAESSIYGQVMAQASTLSSQQYSYDTAGRLTLVKDTPQGGSCTTRSYSYDDDSNRTALVTREPGFGGVCDTSSPGTPQTYEYDKGDRLLGSGLTYDNFGRITSLPGTYAGGSTLATGYFSNEMVASQSQGGLTNTYQLDSAGRPRQVTQTGTKTGTEVFHYAMASDSTAWTERGGAWTRNIAGIGGELAAIQDSATGTSLQLTNLHGDIVATASPSPTATGPTATFEFDEFGNPKQAGSPRFGWLGGKQRRTELPSGVIQMGVRSYVPAMGRFISTDLVSGGSANAYDYAEADPINEFDLDGTCIKRRCRPRGGALAPRFCQCGGAGGGRQKAQGVPSHTPGGRSLTFDSCVPRGELGTKVNVGVSIVSGGTPCVPKVVVCCVNRTNFGGMMPVAKAIGFAWCVSMNTFPGSSSVPGLAMSAAGALIHCRGERAWAYVQVRAGP